MGLRWRAIQKLFKVVVFVPRTHMHDVRMALADAGWLVGQLQSFLVSVRWDKAHSNRWREQSIFGSVGQEEEVEEYRLETIVSETRLAKALANMRKAHPYEEALRCHSNWRMKERQSFYDRAAAPSAFISGVK